MAKHVGATIGWHVLIAVTDTGIGMDEETQKRIFEPFFTTKELGRGSGLGLATVYGIVKQNKASIYVYSEPERGSTFKIYWPAAEGGQKIKPAWEDQELPVGQEKILLVEDEPRVKEFIEKVLQFLGYKVYVAPNGEEALRLVEEGLKPDLLITDLIMPQMGGRELAYRLKKKFPSLPVLFISGYSNELFDFEEQIFLQKPFNITQIAQKVRKLLDETAEGGSSG